MRVGRYEIVGELGRGGMARVHLARQLDLDRFAALKELGSLQREDAEMAARFVRESRLAGALNHTCIVTVLDFFEHDGTPYIAMEYVPRGSLRPWVGRLDLAQVGGVLESVLAGLAHAHGHGVIHRDLKPENLMVTDEGRVKITDFGIAKALAGEGTAAFRTATGATLGTPSYMAPEQAMGDGIGPWTDLYAVGVIAYELLCGSVPFTSHEPLAVLLAHFQQAPPPLLERAPDVPEPIAAWVHALLAKAPADRPESARVAWEELEEHLLECIGPRWRRMARIEGDPGEAGVNTPSGRPLTPAQFTSEDHAWETFGTAPSRTPELPATTQYDAPPAAPGELPPETPSLRSRRRGRTLAIGGAVLAAAVTAVALAVALPGADETSSPPAATGSDGAAPKPAGSAAAPLGDRWLRAIHIVSYEPEGFTKPEYVDALRRAKADGATHVVLHPMLVTAGTTSSELTDMDDAPTDETLVAGIQAADREGLETIIHPVVEPEGNYAGAYDPSDPDAFFETYERRLADFAEMAGEHGSDWVVAGSLLSLLDGPDYTDRWTAILNDTRERCGCRVTYAAEDVEAAERIEFWTAADVIGVTPLAALTDEPSTDPATLTEAWAPTKRRLEALNARWDKPVLITELGYESKADQAAASVYGASGDVSQDAQAALYEAAFRAFRGAPWFAGIGWFWLDGDGDEPAPEDYGFAGKRAEDVMRAWHTAR